MNNDTGTLYLKSQLISAVTGQAEDAWLSVETGEMVPSSLIENISDCTLLDVGNEANFKYFVANTLKEKLLYDSDNYIVEALAEF